MILSKPDIQQRLNSDEGLKIDPFPKEASIGSVSVNLRLGRKFTTFKAAASTKHIATIRVTPSVFQSEDLWDHQVDVDSFDLPSGGFVLAQTLATITMPNDLMGFVEGRSSWARVGLSVHLTAPKIDPGFIGTITLEIANIGPKSVRLEAENDEPAQLILMKVSTPLGIGDTYGKAEGDIFQLQSDPIPHKGT